MHMCMMQMVQLDVELYFAMISGGKVIFDKCFELQMRCRLNFFSKTVVFLEFLT